MYDSTTITVKDNEISGNTANDGGGIDVGGCDGTIYDNTINYNAAGSNGGGICENSSPYIVIGGTGIDQPNTICGNIADQIYSYSNYNYTDNNICDTCPCP